MTRAGAPRISLREGEERTRILVAAAVRADDLHEVVTAEMGGLLPGGVASLWIGVTSPEPRDESARAARWVSRLAARRGMAATLIGPTSHSATAWSVRPDRDRSARLGDGRSLAVGVARLDLSPVIAAVDQPYAVGIWLPLEPRVVRLRRSVTTEPDRQLIDAALAARPIATVLIGLAEGIALTVVGSDLLAVEVTGRAIRSAAQPVGDLGLSPWETPVVQRGIELGAGITHPDLIDLESVWLGDPRDRGHDRLHRIVETASGRAGIGRAAVAAISSP